MSDYEIVNENAYGTMKSVRDDEIVNENMSVRTRRWNFEWLLNLVMIAGLKEIII